LEKPLTPALSPAYRGEGVSALGLVKRRAALASAAEVVLFKLERVDTAEFERVDPAELELLVVLGRHRISAPLAGRA
jgi:hypothetical protein